MKKSKLQSIPYLRIVEELRSRIRDGAYPESLPSISSLSREFSVCSATVKRVLSQLRDSDLVDGKQGKCVSVNPKADGNPLFRRKIVVYAPLVKVHNTFYGTVLDELNRLISSVYGSFHLFVSLEQLKECGFRPDILVAVDTLSDVILEELLGYVAADHLILLNRMNSRYHYVSSDNIQVGYTALSYLSETCGHRHIGMLASQLQYPKGCLKLRLDGALQYAKEHPELVFSFVEIPDTGTDDEYLPWVEQLIRTDPEITAIFGATDLLAVGAYAYVARQGKKIPADLAVLGFDNQRFSRTLFPKLSTFSEKSLEMGQLLFDCIRKILLCESSEIPLDQTILQPELIIRQSTGNIKKTANPG